MKKIVSIVFLIVLAYYISEIFWYPKYKYIYSPDGASRITRIEFDTNEIYFTYGIYNGDSIPESYVRPIFSRDYREGFIAYVFWKSDTCIIYTYDSADFLSKNIVNTKFKHNRLWIANKKNKAREWEKIVNDKSGKYVKIMR